MKVLVPGHLYTVPNFEDPTKEQFISFIHKEPVIDTTSANYGKLRTVRDGTTNEELLEVLIDRMKFLDNKLPCSGNRIVIRELERALVTLKIRTRVRQRHKIEGSNLPHDSIKPKYQVQVRYPNGGVKESQIFETNAAADSRFDELEKQLKTSEWMTPPNEGSLVLLRHDEEGIHIMRELNIVP